MNESPLRLRSLPFLGPLLARVSRFERWTIAAMAMAAVALFAFARLGEEMVEGETRVFDESLLLALRSPANPADPIGPGWFEEMMRDFTALGGTGVLVMVTVTVAGYFLISKRRDMALIMVGSVATGMLLSQALKWGFARPRPELVPPLARVYTYSFPSGHAMLSAVTYLTLGVLLTRTQITRTAKAYLLAVAIGLTLIIGFSRIYLGVHWPTDVLAGWASGAAWAIICWLFLLWLQGRGRVGSDQSI